MSTLTDRVRVHLVLNPATQPKIRQHVLCSNIACGWRGQILQTDILREESRRNRHIYIVCPDCGGELIDLSTDEPRRWI